MLLSLWRLSAVVSAPAMPAPSPACSCRPTPGSAMSNYRDDRRGPPPGGWHERYRGPPGDRDWRNERRGPPGSFDWRDERRGPPADPTGGPSGGPALRSAAVAVEKKPAIDRETVRGPSGSGFAPSNQLGRGSRQAPLTALPNLQVCPLLLRVFPKVWPGPCRQPSATLLHCPSLRGAHCSPCWCCGCPPPPPHTHTPHPPHTHTPHPPHTHITTPPPSGQLGAHHQLGEYMRRGQEPKDEVQMYTWMDATLRWAGGQEGGRATRRAEQCCGACRGGSRQRVGAACAGAACRRACSGGWGYRRSPPAAAAAPAPPVQRLPSAGGPHGLL